MNPFILYMEKLAGLPSEAVEAIVEKAGHAAAKSGLSESAKIQVKSMARYHAKTGSPDSLVKTLKGQGIRDEHLGDVHAEMTKHYQKPAAPAAEAPKTEAPAAEAPKTEAPAAEAPKTEAPAAEAPKTEAPAAEAPKTEAPAAEAPKTEAPAAETPKTEAPKENKPKDTDGYWGHLSGQHTEATLKKTVASAPRVNGPEDVDRHIKELGKIDDHEGKVKYLKETLGVHDTSGYENAVRAQKTARIATAVGAGGGTVAGAAFLGSGGSQQKQAAVNPYLHSMCKAAGEPPRHPSEILSSNPFSPLTGDHLKGTIEHTVWRHSEGDEAAAKAHLDAMKNMSTDKKIEYMKGKGMSTAAVEDSAKMQKLYRWTTGAGLAAKGALVVGGLAMAHHALAGHPQGNQ